jgi:hypothetical protein
MGTSSIPSGGGGGLAPKYQKFTASGTFTLPDGYGAAKPLLINIQVIGAGGGGSGIATMTFNGNGGHRNYFGQGWMEAATIVSPNTGNGAGGSGGLCSTQLYLTSNLTVTVGAAGARGGTVTNTNNENPYGGNYGNTGGGSTVTIPAYVSAITGGTGGTTTASVLQATGGVGGTVTNFEGGRNMRYSIADTRLTSYMQNSVLNQTSAGAGGTPAGTNGLATPLLGTLAGGASSTTPVRGSFGIGGVSTDAGTSTGAEGTGGGYNSIGASGAVIITWWQ